MKHFNNYLMKKDKYLIIAFDSTSHALDLEDKAKNKMQGGCGLCFASLELDQEKWHRFLEEEHVQYAYMKEVIF